MESAGHGRGADYGGPNWRQRWPGVGPLGSGTLVFDDFQWSANFVVGISPDYVTNGSASIRLQLSNPRPDGLEDPSVITPGLLNSSATLTVRQVLGTNINGGTNFSVEKARYYVEEAPRQSSPFSNAFVVVDVLLPAGGPGEVDYETFPGLYTFLELSPGSDHAHDGTWTFPTTPF